MKQSCASWIARVLTVVMLSAITFGVAAKPPKPTHEDPINSASLNDEQARNFVALLSDVVQGVLARQGRTDAFISVRLDKSHSRVVIDLTQDYLPQGQRNFGSELQDRLHTITTEIVQMANFDLKIIVENVDYTFDGQGLHFYYPEDFSVQDGDPLSGLDFGQLGGPGQIVARRDTGGSQGYRVHAHPGQPHPAAGRALPQLSRDVG